MKKKQVKKLSLKLNKMKIAKLENPKEIKGGFIGGTSWNLDCTAAK